MKTKKRSEALDRAQKKYLEKFTRVTLRIDDEMYQDILAHNNLTGESVNGFITRAVKEQMKRDSQEIEKQTGH